MIANENSIWDVYNNVADVEDDELIKDWNDSLNFLLVFVRTSHYRLLASLIFAF
jgi:Family of unknown function (DUF6535)